MSAFDRIFRRVGFSISIRTKIIGLIAFLVIILLLSGYLLQNALSKNAAMIERQSLVISAISEVNTANQIYGSIRWSYLGFLHQPDEYTQAILHEALNNMRQQLARMQGDVFAPLEIDRVSDSLLNLENMATPYIALAAGSPERDDIAENVIDEMEVMEGTLDDISDVLKLRLNQISRQTLHTTHSLHNIPLVFMIGGLATLGFVTLIVFVNIFSPINKITRAMTTASMDTDNAKSYALPVRQYDEIGRAALALNRLLIEVSSGIEKTRKTETRLREVSQYLQAILDNMVDGIIIVNRAGVIETYNPGAEKILGHSAQDMIGSDFSHLEVESHPRIYSRIKEGQHDHLQDNDSNSGSIQSPSESALLCKDGSIKPVEIAIGNVIHAGENIYILTIRDISVRKEMEAMLRQAQRMETIGAMGGGIAHDFNNMLIVISGNLELIERRVGDDPATKEMIENALESIERGKDLTQRLLAFSRKQVLMPRTFNINEKLPQIVDLMNRVVPEDIEIITNKEEDLWDINVDSAQLENAILNLAINARDALLNKKDAKITIKTGNVTIKRKMSPSYGAAAPGEYVSISITDNGAGIAPGVMDKIFDPFFTTKDVGKGTGLGLSMVYGFTRQSGGYVQANSKPDKGTTITLLFPRTKVTKNDEDAPYRHLIKKEKDWQVSGGSESVMIVEDNPEVLKFMVSTLRDLGYKVSQATDAGSALNKLGKRKHLDMLVTDVVMPGAMNGEEMAEKALERFPGLKVLYVSGYTKDALVDQGELKPGVTLLSKPFTGKKFAYEVRKILDRQKSFEMFD